MSIIEEALQRKAEEEKASEGQHDKGVGGAPLRTPPKPKGEKRGPLFWVLVVFLIVAVGLVSGIASYLYLFGGNISDLAYLMPVAPKEGPVQPEAFNRSESPPPKGEAATPSRAEKPTTATTQESSQEEPLAREGVPSTENSSLQVQELKSPWRVLKAQENASQPLAKAEAPEERETPEAKVISKEEGATEETEVKKPKEERGKSAQPERQAKREAFGNRKPASSTGRKVPAATNKKTQAKGEESTQLIPSPSSHHSLSQPPSPRQGKKIESKGGISTPPIPSLKKRAIAKGQSGHEKRRGIHEESLVAPPWKENAPEPQLEVYAHRSEEHPYYQEERVEEIPPGKSELAFKEAPKPNPKEVVRKYLRLAIDFQEKGDDTHAIELYKKVLEKDPNCIEALNNLASIYLKKGMVWRAEPLINKAFAFAPHKVEVVTNKAFIEFKRGHYFLAEGLWSQALSMNPSYVPAMLGLGTLYLAEGCPTDAQRILSQALELEPNNPKVIYNLALAMDRCERYEEAIALYKELLSHYKSLSKQQINRVAKRLYDLEKSREGTGIEAMKREKGTW